MYMGSTNEKQPELVAVCEERGIELDGVEY